MAWTTPRTWIPYELVTDTMLNVHVRDNLNALSRPVAQMISGTVSNVGAGWTALYTYQPQPAEALTLDGDVYIVDAFGYFSGAGVGNLKNILIRLGGTAFASCEGVHIDKEFHFRSEIRRSSATVAIVSTTMVIGATSTSTSTPAATIIQRVGVTANWSSAPAIDLYGIGSVSGALYLQSVLIELRRKPL